MFVGVIIVPVLAAIGLYFYHRHFTCSKIGW